MPRVSRITISLLVFAGLAIGAGCLHRPAQENQTSEDDTQRIADALASSTAVLNATTSTPSDATLTRWDEQSFAPLQLGFTPPKGTWVYLADFANSYYLVRSDIPSPSSTNPADLATRDRIATIMPIEWDPKSFPTWESFEVRMAQFDCTEGDSEANFVSCLNGEQNVVEGKTQNGLSFRKYQLEAVRKRDKAPKGMRTYFSIRPRTDGGIGLIIPVNNNAELPAVLEFVKSLKEGS
ncbi:MAG: hypothetical protein WC477_05655 [Patescibacteria group bacterium]